MKTALVSFLLGVLLLWSTLNNYNLKQQNIASKNTIDSLSNELFIQTTNTVRYEIALERLREEDSVSAQKFEDKLSNIE